VTAELTAVTVSPAAFAVVVIETEVEVVDVNTLK
jgi:hypothetical protein